MNDTLAAISYFREPKAQGDVVGLSVEEQQQVVDRFAQAYGVSRQSSYQDAAAGDEVTAQEQYPNLLVAMERAKTAGCAVLVAELGCVSRDVEFISKLMELSVPIIVAGGSLDAEPYVICSFRSLPTDEGSLISERIKAALAPMKGKGLLGNRTNLSEAAEKGRRAQADKADQFAERVLPVVQELQSSGMTTLREISAALNDQGVPTARAGRWTPTTVKRLLDRDRRRVD
jgi:hypothetical protein